MSEIKSIKVNDNIVINVDKDNRWFEIRDLEYDGYDENVVLSISDIPRLIKALSEMKEYLEYGQKED